MAHGLARGGDTTAYRGRERADRRVERISGCRRGVDVEAVPWIVDGDPDSWTIVAVLGGVSAGHANYCAALSAAYRAARELLACSNHAGDGARVALRGVHACEHGRKILLSATTVVMRRRSDGGT